MNDREYELIKQLLKLCLYGFVLIGVIWGANDPSALVGLI